MPTPPPPPPPPPPSPLPLISSSTSSMISSLSGGGGPPRTSASSSSWTCSKAFSSRGGRLRHLRLRMLAVGGASPFGSSTSVGSAASSLSTTSIWPTCPVL
eukprot:scaffold19111_cov51-Phaeocystis_antarctica.AAC.1